jgi:hypothetical protein
MTDKNPVDLDALDALYSTHECKFICSDGCERQEALFDAYPAMSEELRRLRGLVREYAEARQAWDDWAITDGDDALESTYSELDRTEEALYAAGKEIAK